MAKIEAAKQSGTCAFDPSTADRAVETYKVVSGLVEAMIRSSIVENLPSGGGLSRNFAMSSITFEIL